MQEKPQSFQPSSEKEKSKESLESFRGSLGLDFIFYKGKDGKRHCLCIEINGDDAGIAGVQSIPKGDISSTQRSLAYIRDTRGKKRIEQAVKAEAIIDDLNTGVFSATEQGKEKIVAFVKESVHKHPLLVHAFRNPKFIQDMTLDKSLQKDFIPKKYSARVFEKGASSVSSTGYWVYKPKRGRAGRNIRILTNKEFATQ